MDLEVDRSHLDRVQVRNDAPASLAEGEARVEVERFALSANNISYAVFGDMLGYWDFFPVPADPADATPWGRIPVWGYGRVVESRCDGLQVGRRLFGYLPMSSETTFTGGRFDDRGFSDVSSHRSGMAAAYNRYVFVDRDPAYRADREPHQMLLYPLFFTAFVVDDFLADDFLADDDDHGAEQLWLSSASAKTSIGVAYLAKRRGTATVVGLTSERNRAFVEGLGVYDGVASYDEVTSIDPAAAVFVDVAGNDDVTRSVHAHLGESLVYSMRVGGTHWDHEAGPAPVEPMVGPTPEFFFAPTQLAKRAHEWGQDELDARMGAAWGAYASWIDEWLRFERYEGVAAVEAAYHGLLANQADPSTGHICTLVNGTDAAG